VQENLPLKIKPSVLAEKILKLNGKPFSLQGREYLRKIHDGNFKNVLLRTGRQVEKSTTLAVHMITRAILIPYFTALYITPSSKQTRMFSAQKLNPFIKTSDFIQKYFVDKNCTDRVFEKSFSNGSRIVLDYVFLTADRVRGISADALYLDEIQDIMSDHIPVIEETLSHSRYKFRIYAGTPKRYQNPIERLWESSSQTEWVVKCESCNHWNVLGEKNVRKEGLSCARCGKLLDVRVGEWVNMRESYTFKGIRIPQLIASWMDWGEIWRKYLEYPTAKFYNEVLGLPYEDAARPITQEDILNACEPRPMVFSYDPGVFKGEPLFLGIDYAPASFGEQTAYTVVAIGGFVGDTFKVVYLKRYKGVESDLSFVVEDVAALARKFKVARVGADWGVGSGGANQFLRRALGSPDKVIEFYYSGSQKQLVTWDWKGGRFVLNRTEAMSHVMLKIKTRKITFPRWSDFSEFAADFLNIYQDFSETTGRVLFDHDGPDDAFHAVLYAYMVGALEKGILKPSDAKTA